MNNLPQIIYFVVLGISLLLSANGHGKEKSPKTQNFWVDLIGYVFTFILLYWGGFFDVLTK